MVSPSVSYQADLPLSFLWWPYNERVALLAGEQNDSGYTVVDIIPITNHDHNTYAFSVLRTDYERIATSLPSELAIIGALHTHILPNQDGPSREDIKGLPANWLGVILHLPTRRLLYYQASDQS